MKYNSMPAFILFLSLGLAGCSSDESPIGPSEEAFDLADFVEIMFNNGVGVDVIGEIEEPLFQANSILITVQGEPVEVYEFQGAFTTGEALSVISADGTQVGSLQIPWEATPHFFMNGRILVLYVGDNPEVLAIFRTFLGPQIAGG